MLVKRIVNFKFSEIAAVSILVEWGLTILKVARVCTGICLFMFSLLILRRMGLYLIVCSLSW